MALVKADYSGGREIRFTAGGKVLVNSRERQEGHPERGFLSGELLLMALGSCTLATLLNHSLLREFPPESCAMTLESREAANPRRYVQVSMKIEIQSSKLPREHLETLQRVADKCTIGNTLKQGLGLDVDLRLV